MGCRCVPPTFAAEMGLAVIAAEVLKLLFLRRSEGLVAPPKLDLALQVVLGISQALLSVDGTISGGIEGLLGLGKLGSATSSRSPRPRSWRRQSRHRG